MTTLLLIRHGENNYLKKYILPGRIHGIHLNGKGRQQAEALATALEDLPIVSIYASPLERAVETAQPLALALGLKVHTEPNLMDTDVGEWTGRSWKALQKTDLWQSIQHSPSRFRFPGGESFAENQARIIAALEQITAAHKEEELVAVVFHADPIKLAIAYYIGLPLDRFQSLVVDTGSVSVLMLGKASTRLVALGLKPPFEISL